MPAASRNPAPKAFRRTLRPVTITYPCFTDKETEALQLVQGGPGATWVSLTL